MQPGQFQMPTLGGGAERSAGAKIESPAVSPTPENKALLPSPTIEGLKTAERPTEQAGELRAIRNDISSAAAASTLASQPQTTVQPVQDNTSSVVNLSTPTSANDDDVIEKAWVDTAKEIVDRTAGDPSRRGTEIGAIKKDYLKKRFGKDLGAPPA